MYRLTIDQIQFIDTYLENSEVRHVDVRMEMVDHVASALETELSSDNDNSFYEAFKDYMVINKAKLLKQNKGFLNQVDKKIFKLLLKNMLTVKSLLVFAFLYFGFSKALDYYGLETFTKKALYIPFTVMFFAGLVYLILMYVFKFHRFAVIERLFLPYVIMIQLANVLQSITKLFLSTEGENIIAIGLVSFFMLVLISLMETTIQIHKKYHNRIKALS